MIKRIDQLKLELAIIGFILTLSFLLFSKFDVLEKIVALSSEYERYEIDEIVSTLIVFAFCMAWFSFRRWRETLKNNPYHRKTETRDCGYP